MIYKERTADTVNVCGPFAVSYNSSIFLSAPTDTLNRIPDTAGIVRIAGILPFFQKNTGSHKALYNKKALRYDTEELQ